MEALMKNIWRIIPVLLLSVAMAGCSDDDDTTSSFFELSSTVWNVTVIMLSML